MSQNLAKNEAFKPQELSLEECISELEKYGNPRLSKDSGTWHCSIKVFVIGEGTEFRVSSNFKHQRHREAANLCLSRLMLELQRIKET